MNFHYLYRVCCAIKTINLVSLFLTLSFFFHPSSTSPACLKLKTHSFGPETNEGDLFIWSILVHVYCDHQADSYWIKRTSWSDQVRKRKMTFSVWCKNSPAYLKEAALRAGDLNSTWGTFAVVAFVIRLRDMSIVGQNLLSNNCTAYLLVAECRTVWAELNQSFAREDCSISRRIKQLWLMRRKQQVVVVVVKECTPSGRKTRQQKATPNSDLACSPVDHLKIDAVLESSDNNNTATWLAAATTCRMSVSWTDLRILNLGDYQ